MIVAALVSVVIVSFLGVIGLVGLVCPHTVRKLIGGDQRYLIPGSCVSGGELQKVSIARVLVQEPRRGDAGDHRGSLRRSRDGRAAQRVPLRCPPGPGERLIARGAGEPQ